MQNAAQAYSNTAQKTVTPREREASLLIKSASQMQSAIDNWQNGDRDTLRHALQYNRKLWTVFVSSISGTENPLPVAIKNNIGSLGVFIFRHTVSVLARPSPEKLDVLIAINRDIAAGLREQA